MSDPLDDFWRRPPRERREVMQEAMGRLSFGNGQPEPAKPGPLDMTEEEYQAFRRRSDEMWVHGYVTVPGAPYPLSRELAIQLNYDVDHLPSPGRGYTAGDDEAGSD